MRCLRQAACDNKDASFHLAIVVVVCDSLVLVNSSRMLSLSHSLTGGSHSHTHTLFLRLGRPCPGIFFFLRETALRGRSAPAPKQIGQCVLTFKKRSVSSTAPFWIDTYPCSSSVSPTFF